MKHTKFICVVVTLLSAFVATVKAGEWIREQDRFPYALVQEPAAQAGAYMYAGTGLPYYPSKEFAAVPDSLSTIFVNHIGRHGARFLSSSKYTKKVLNYLHRCGPLSLIGRNMLWLCNRIDSITADRWGALDSIGKNEQDSIGTRFYHRYPGLFERRDSIYGFSSYVPRCVMSMDCMTHAVIWCRPKINMAAGSGPRFNNLVRFFETNDAYKEYMKSTGWRAAYDAYVDSICPVEPVLRLALHAPEISKHEAQKIAMAMYKVVAGGMCIIDYLDWRPFFLEQEYRELWQISNLQHYLTHSANIFSLEPEQMARPLLRELIATLDSAANQDYDGPAAIVRFGHAETLMPLLSLMHIDGCRYISANLESVANNWQDSYIVPMAANLQLALCRSKLTDKLYLITYLNEGMVGKPQLWGKARKTLVGYCK